MPTSHCNCGKDQSCNTCRKFIGYRDNAIPPKSIEPLEPFSIRYPLFWKTLQYLTGLFVVPTIWLAFYLIGPGTAHLGRWFGNSIMHWRIEGMDCWGIGLLLNLSFVGFIFMPQRIGKILLEKFYRAE